jgi:hypothetical protein
MSSSEIEALGYAHIIPETALLQDLVDNSFVSVSGQEIVFSDNPGTGTVSFDNAETDSSTEVQFGVTHADLVYDRGLIHVVDG